MVAEHFAAPVTVDRRFWGVLAVSVSLHATAVFLIHSPFRDDAKELPPLQVSLRLPAEIAPAAPAIASKAPPVGKPVASKPAEPVVNREKILAKPEPLRPIPAPVTAQTPPAPTMPAPSVSTASVSTPLPSQIQTTRQAAPPTPAVDLLANYRDRLASLFAGQQEYPRVAAMRGWEGDVLLRLKVARKGNLVGVQIDRSSGFDVLDRHAMAMIERISNFPPLPDGLDGNEIQLVVPVQYKLRKAT